ncbi:MAG: hypothetical protein KJO82_10520 [Gammaproteobacteria bacterium]|nr:hypothetical protein [Gammaproteobacteria bacterium]
MGDEAAVKRIRVARRLGVALLALIILGALQTVGFYQRFAPRVEQANQALYALTLENTQRGLYRELATNVELLIESVPDDKAGGRTLVDAWTEFDAHFATAPFEASATLQDELPVVLAGSDANAMARAAVAGSLERLQLIYADHYKPLLADLKRPPLYLWPMAKFAAGRSGYRQALTLNRAVYLAQTGDIGTSRVMLAGLSASVEAPDLLATVYYTLGRLQFELFRATPEIEYYRQSVSYLQQSLVVRPDMQLAQRLLDFLLSLPPAATAPQAAEGRPETPAEGEGAAVSAEKRIF